MSEFKPPQPNNQDNFKSQQEQSDIKMEVAKPENWEAYKELRLLAIGKTKSGPDDEQIIEEEARSKEEWQKDLSGENKFLMLSWNGTEAIGMGLAEEKDEKGVWKMWSGYVKPEFRGGVGKRMFEARLNEIRRRGGKKVTLYVKSENKRSIHIAESFGFKKMGTGASKDLYLLQLDLTTPREAIK